MFKILVVEDDPNTRLLMQKVLSQNGYEPIPAADGIEALDVLDKKRVDLILLDVMLPRMDGYEFTRVLRESGEYRDTPILMVTAREAREDKREGFTSGADDYMVKPVDEEEMILRISALLRRAHIMNEHRLLIGGTLLDYDSFSVSSGGYISELPKKEFLLIYKLLSYPGRIFTRRHLMDEIWDMDSETDERTVDVHINRLRDRFKDNPDFEIVTVRGLGYKAQLKQQGN